MPDQPEAALEAVDKAEQVFVFVRTSTRHDGNAYRNEIFPIKKAEAIAAIRDVCDSQ